jgi:uncharacterized protein YwqG
MGFIRRLFGKVEEKKIPEALSDDTSLGQKLARLRRTTWIPKTKSGDCSPAGSKFSGLAFIPEGEQWPECGNCERPMQLFVQLNANDVPEEAGHLLSNGLLQLFYCTSSEPQCDVECAAFFAFSKAHLARVIDDGPAGAYTESPVSDPFPARSIVGWTSVIDAPNWEESERMGIAFEDEEADKLADTNLPADGEKLGGWPAWIQGVEYPNCPQCDQPMEFLFQIDSEKNIPFLLGDAGIGHVTRCKSHPDVLTFGWACG